MPRTESARLRGSVDEGQRVRNAKLEAYLDNDLEGTDKTFGKIIAGSLILTLIALLGGVLAYTLDRSALLPTGPPGYRLLHIGVTLQVRLHVLTGDVAVRATRGKLVEIDAVVLGHLSYRWGRKRLSVLDVRRGRRG